MGVQRISLDPDPPTAGASVLICYDFDGSGLFSTNLTTSFRPGGAPVTFEVTVASPCKWVKVPSGTTHLVVEDDSGISPDRVSPVA